MRLHQSASGSGLPLTTTSSQLNVSDNHHSGGLFVLLFFVFSGFVIFLLLQHPRKQRQKPMVQRLHNDNDGDVVEDDDIYLRE